MRLVAILILSISLPAAADISRLSWLTGCWAYDGKDAGSGEYWMPPAGGTMLAISRTVHESKTVGFEYLRITETGDESLILIAAPSGQNATRFSLLSITNNEVVFENPEHDFPQRIIYRLGNGGTLLGRVEGESDGNNVVVDFPMTRIDCAAFGR